MSVPNNTNSPISSCSQQKRRASEVNEDSNLKKIRVEKSTIKNASSSTQCINKQKRTDTWCTGINREELMVRANDDGLKLITVKDASTPPGDDLIVIRNFGSTEFSNVVQSTSPLNTDELSDEYVLFASDVMDYIDNDNYLVAPSKVDSQDEKQRTAEARDVPRTKAVNKECNITELSEHIEVDEIPERSPSMNEIEFVLLPSHKETMENPSNKTDSIMKESGTIASRLVPISTSNITSTVPFNRSSSCVVPSNLFNNMAGLPSNLKGQQFVVGGTKKVTSEVKQTTAKVSIGNTTISVPLLKPLSSCQVIQPSNIFTDTSRILQASAAPPSLQQTQFSLNKILNVKRSCPKFNQPTIVSLSQLQIKPLSTAKIVQAKVVGKKMQLQLPNVLPTTNVLSSGSSSSVVTITASKSKQTSIQNISYIKSPTKKELVSSTGDNCVLLCSTDKATQEVPITQGDGDNLLNNMKLVKVPPKENITTNVVKKNEPSTSTTSTQISIDLECNSTSKNTIKKMLASANSNNNPPTLMPLCKLPEQSKQLQVLSNVPNKKSFIASSVKIIKQTTGVQSISCQPPAGISSVSVSGAESKVGVDTQHSFDSVTTKSQPAAQVISGSMNKVAGSSLITMPRNISLLLTKGKNSHHISPGISNTPSTVNFNANSTVDQISKKLNICRTNSLNITALNLPQSSTHSVETNTAPAMIDNITSKASIKSVAIQSSDSNIPVTDSKVNIANITRKTIKIPTSSVSFLGTSSGKRVKSNENDFEKEEFSNYSSSLTKKTNLDMKNESLSIEHGKESLQKSVKNVPLESEDINDSVKIHISTSQANTTITTIPNKQEETHNVLLKQLLQNACNSVATSATKSPSPPVCSQVISARKVINVRAPSLGLVSSLEAQLARPVIPPVPTTTHQELQMDLLMQKNTVQHSLLEKESTTQHEFKPKSTVQIISKETSFVSQPNVGNKCLEDQSTGEVQNFVNSPSRTLVPFSESAGVLKQKESSQNSSAGIETNDIKMPPKEEQNSSHIKTSENKGNISNISSTSTTAAVTTVLSTDPATKLFANKRNAVTKITSLPEEVCGADECSPIQNNDINKEETVPVAKYNNENKFKDSGGSVSAFKTGEPTEILLKNSNTISATKEISNEDTATDIILCEVQQNQPPLNKPDENIIKLTPVKDITKDAEFRKKRKRDYQKHRRQHLNNNKDVLTSSPSTSVSSTSTYNNKKRPRKLLRVEEDYDHFIDNLMSHIRHMQPLQVLEPVLSSNYNACNMVGRTSVNVKESADKFCEKLFGEFGNAKHSQIKSCYDEQNLDRIEGDEDQNMLIIQNDFYDQEFLPITCRSKSEKIIRFIGMVKERSSESEDTVCNKNKICFNNMTESQRSGKYNVLTFLSYPGLILKNNRINQTFGRMSPILPVIEPTLDSSLRLPLRLLKENDSKTLIDQKSPSDALLTNGENSWKSSQNETVILSLPLSAVNNIVGFLKDLASLLNIKSMPEYKIVDPVNTEIKWKLNSPIRRKSLNDAQKTYMQEILNGRRKICGNCGKPITAGGVRTIRKALDTRNSDFDLLPVFESYVYFCSRICYMHKKLQASNSALNPSSKIKKNSMDGIPSSTKKSESTTQSDGGTQQKQKFKYYAENCFSTTPLLKNSNEKEILDMLFKLDITVSAKNDKQQPIEDTRQCIFCNQRGDCQPDGPSRLLNFDIDKYVHLNCALWSNGVYETISGGLMNLHLAIQIGLSQACVACQNFGATVKCIKNRCFAIYHLPCALKEGCVFYKNKTVHCQQHASKMDKENELLSLAVYRRVFVERDENRQVAAVMHHPELSNLLRIGSLTFLNIGQLLPHQLEAFHNSNFIYPIGYQVIRFYWSMKRPNKRCRYVCSIVDVASKPEFRIQVHEPHEEEIQFQDSTPKGVWLKVLEPIAALRNDKYLVQLFTKYISGEDLFGLTEPSIVRIIESLPGVENLTDYRLKYGRNPLLELPLAINPSGSARTEPKQRQVLGWRKPHTQRTGTFSNQRVANAVSSVVAGEVTCPYSKQFVHSKSSQYKKMKQEWRNNVYLARSKIQGLGLYAARDMEKHTMIIEYIGEVIRTEVSEIREKQYEARNRGIYMFRLDEERVVDATLSGGLARYINHSCNPNCVTEIVEVDRELRIIIFAKRRISRGEELSYDYKFDIEDDANKIQCMCGAPNCRKWMN